MVIISPSMGQTLPVRLHPVFLSVNFEKETFADSAYMMMEALSKRLPRINPGVAQLLSAAVIRTLGCSMYGRPVTDSLSGKETKGALWAFPFCPLMMEIVPSNWVWCCSGIFYMLSLPLRNALLLLIRHAGIFALL